MAEVRVRGARPGDGAALAGAWVEAGAYYASLDDDAFQVPAVAGLAEDLERELAGPLPDDHGWLVGELDGDVVGYVYGQLHRPGAGARWQLVRDASATRLHVDALVVAARARRAGVGRALLAAIEEWAAARGAVVVTLETYARSPLSVPFYESLGYQRHNVGFRKRLGSA